MISTVESMFILLSGLPHASLVACAGEHRDNPAPKNGIHPVSGSEAGTPWAFWTSGPMLIPYSNGSFPFNPQVIRYGEYTGHAVGLDTGHILVHLARDHADQRDMTVIDDDVDRRNSL